MIEICVRLISRAYCFKNLIQSRRGILWQRETLGHEILSGFIIIVSYNLKYIVVFLYIFMHCVPYRFLGLKTILALDFNDR